jgi:hypothetical protein
MGKFLLFLPAVLCAAQLASASETSAKAPVQTFTWGLYWGGSWEESKTLANRGEIKLGFTPAALLVRGQALDKRPLDITASPPWSDESSKAISSLGAGIYHKASGSRLLYGVLDEWGLSARIRSPWIRGAPFVENHKPLMADLKTAASSTKEPEAYLYLSSPWLSLFPNTAWRGFGAAQIKAAYLDGQAPESAASEQSGYTPDLSGGIEARINPKTRILLEGFFTDAILPARKSSSWFADPAPLPEREFRLYGMGLLYDSLYWSISSDWAYSETFAWGRDIYGNLGILISPPLGASAGKPGPWTLSLAADGAGQHFTARDGSNPGAGFRAAGKIEYRGKGASLFRLNTTVRSPGMGEDFNRSSSGVYYRFPAPSKKKGTEVIPVRVTRVSLGMDRNADDQSKILDRIDGTVGLSLLPVISSPLGINISGQLRGRCSADEAPSPYPLPQYPYSFDSAKASGEITWAPGAFQFRTKWGYEVTAKKEGKWDSSASAALRFKHGRFSVKIASPDFPDDWNCTLSWHLEKK